MNKLASFKQMHAQDEPLFLPNAWDILSAIIMQQNGFKAIGTTSWGIANSLGYQDGERIQFAELLTIVNKIVSAVEIPVTVDVESGYSEDMDIVAKNILQLANMGVVGINIEDSLKSKPSLRDKNAHCEQIEKIRNILNKNGYQEFFINARTDTYLQLKNPLAETLERAVDYVSSGADGIFVPGLSQAEEIKQLTATIKAPLNIMSLPSLVDTKGLKELGVKRFSLGSSFSDATVAFIEENTRILMAERSTEKLYAGSKISTLFR
ncbi:MAG: isocitrate lyase/phosphoenolpyruvate mutase family protein [Xanthomonadales bacterium]|nr:isocitrate lyase/phosphoenolpyruvate mutase family protein [Xanthomonadales bacterium]